MPVTKTAKRALRSSKKKLSVNSAVRKNLEVALRLAKKGKSQEKIQKAISLVDRAAKKHVIHKNKAARIKSGLSKLLPHTKSKPQVKKKSSKKK
ncbi:hypothetical protein A2614_00635 [Candidatus Woesebacteria bacterium RIFOXYD1_FULL_40_21]|uniref:Small ribosomal subunit protein bS20 n=1 Tax=Candidatus Woesebacteria bacterium RIFOXYD1_FULL_40_21 TaxID=1802549 RepID=A0A1F8DLR2_9BACT|nr:MAG: hypothetical protein A2614_00635 [Candidatus Woesebacteria bacterium RIFOXYD1_FULL_40_21]